MKGAPGHIYNILLRHATDGHCVISYLALAAESDYSIPTVATAIQQLAADGLIVVETGGNGRPNRYQLIQPHFDGYRWS